VKRILFAIISILFSQAVFAYEHQPDTSKADSTRSGSYWSDDLSNYIKSKVTIESEYFFGSNALTIDLASTYFMNGFINNGMKDVVSRKLDGSNRFGAGFKYEFSYRHQPDSLFGLSNSFYQIGFRDVFHLDSKFNNDVFELYFRGNKKYAGKTADIGNFEFNQLFYQQIYFMFGHSFIRSGNKFEYSIGLNFNKGHKLLIIEATDASIYTQEDGEYLDLDASLEIHRNDSAKNEKLAFNGIGGSIDFNFKWTDKKNRSLEFKTQNLGMIAWNNQSAFIEADTAFKFEGVDISELFDFSDSVTNSISLDSSLVEPYLTKRIKKEHTTPLPALIQFKYSIPIEKYKTIASTEVGYLLFANCKPYVRQSFQYKINYVHSIGLSLSYGGYSNFDVGLNYELKFKSYKFKLKSDAITGFFMKDATSQGAFVSLSKSF